MPEQHAPAGPSLAGRFAAAIALTIGFYVLALAIALGLLAVAVLPWVFNGSNNIWVTLTCAFLGGSILFAIVPRRLRFETPGLKVTRGEQPRLFELIEHEARQGGEPVPDDVYLTLDANAAVTQASRTRRVLIVGIPLMHILSERELRGVLAHEFGHYSGGDTRLGPWIYRTRATIIRTVEQLSDDEGDEGWTQRAVRLPFIWYARAFLRITAAISRRQEFAADACAARSVGRAAHVAALERIHAYAPGFDFYWQEEVVPVLSAGRRPPVSEGFRRFIAHEAVEQAAGEQLEREREAETDRYDSHPSLPERIAAVAGLPDGEPDESPCSIEAVADPETIERRLLEFLFGAEVRDLEPVRWEAVGSEVYGRRAHELVERFPAVVADTTIGQLPEAVADIPARASKLDDVDVEDRAGFAAHVLGDAVLVALERAGWTIEAPPAEPVAARRGDTRLIPHAAVHALRAGELDAEQWREQVTELGVADVELAARAGVAAS